MPPLGAAEICNHACYQKFMNSGDISNICSQGEVFTLNGGNGYRDRMIENGSAACGISKIEWKVFQNV